MITDDELFDLEHAVERALNSGDISELSLLGEGEITLVLRGGTEGAWACKRLPPFATGDAARRYAATIDRYVGELRRRGTNVLDTDVRRIAGAPDRRTRDDSPVLRAAGATAENPGRRRGTR